MSKMEGDQEILKLISQLFVDIWKGTRLWELPDAHASLINFSGSQMEKLLADEKRMNLNSLKRKPQFTVDNLSAFVVQLLLHSFLIGRNVNKIRLEQGRQPVDWYERVIEEDQNARKPE